MLRPRSRLLSAGRYLGRLAFRLLAEGQDSEWSHLGLGTTYVCEMPQARGFELRRLRYIDKVMSVDMSGLSGHVASVAVLEDDDGENWSAPISAVLWRADDHEHIVRATAQLQLPLVPPRRHGRPDWRVGHARLEAQDLAVLGRTLAESDR